MPRVQVIIDVVESGFTGQRDQWETYTGEAIVSLQDDGRTVRLLHRDHSQRRIQFERQELLDALRALDATDSSAT